MKQLIEKVQKVLPLLFERGTVYLFALFERDDAPGKWDVVLSSDWSDKDTPSAIRFVSDLLIPTLLKEELSALSRIAIIPSTAPAVGMMTSALNVRGGQAEVVDCNFMGLLVKHAFVFRTERPPVFESTALPVATSSAV